MSRFRRYFLGAAVPAFLAGMLSVSCAESRGGNSLPAHVTGKTDSLALHYGEDVREDWLGVGLWGIPLPYDWNSDGVKDLLVSCPDTPYKGLYLFINKGTSSRPFFSKAVRLSHVGRNNIRLSEAAGIPHVLSAGKEYPDFFAAPYASGLKINYEGEKLGKDYRKSRSNMWNYADWDGDGKLDLIVGSIKRSSYPSPDRGLPYSRFRKKEFGLQVMLFENVGTNEKMVFKEPVQFQVDGKDVYLGAHSNAPEPCMLGDVTAGPNLLVGCESGKYFFFDRRHLTVTGIPE